MFVLKSHNLPTNQIGPTEISSVVNQGHLGRLIIKRIRQFNQNRIEDHYLRQT